MNHRLIIDTDPGIDDALAIILACHSSEITVEGLTVVHGNASVEHGVSNTLHILNLLHKNIPVYKGASQPISKPYIGAYDTHGDDGLGNIKPSQRHTSVTEHATDFLIRSAAENPRQITLTPIGPLTNIAKAVQKDPKFAKNIKSLILMGGAEHGGNCSPVAEFNFWADPHATDIVFQAGFDDIIMIGLDVTQKIVLTPNLREVIRQYNTPIASFIHKITRMYNDFHWTQERTLGCVINDPLVIAYLLNPEILSLKPAHVRIVTEGPAEGQSIVDTDGFWNQKQCNCRVAYNVDSKKFFELFFERLFPEFTEDNQRIIAQEFSP